MVVIEVIAFLFILFFGAGVLALLNVSKISDYIGKIFKK